MWTGGVFKSALSEPLVQFLLLGSLLFVVDRWAVGRQDDPLQIVIDDAKYAEIAGIYEDNQGEPPSVAEMKNLVIKWAQNEVLYREAQLMELDKGDEMIRQRLILKLRNVLFNRIVPEKPTEAALRQWFELNRDDYDQPESFDFEQFRVGGAEAAREAARLAEEFGNGDVSEPWRDQLRQYRGRPEANLRALFEREHVDALRQAPSGTWIAARSTKGSWHLARIVAAHPGKPAEFEAVRTRVGEAFKATAAQYELAQALDSISDRYDIRVELADPPEGWRAAPTDETQLASRHGAL